MSKPRQFPTGAKRDNNSNKPNVHDFRGYTRLRFGYHLKIGALKYGDGNFLKGMPIAQYLESLDRHLAQYMEGDKSEDHLSAIIFGAQGCMLEEQKLGVTADHYFNKMGDGHYQRPNSNHTVDDMPLDYRYEYVENVAFTKGEMSILVQCFPNNEELGAEIRRIYEGKKPKQNKEFDKEMD